MSEVTIREATAADLDGVRALCSAPGPGDYARDAVVEWRRHDRNQLFTAHLDGRLVGCVHASIVAPGQAFSQALRVDRDVHRRGVASRLMREQDAWLRGRGVRVVRGVTGVNNQRARQFFPTAGWKELGVCRRRRLAGFVPAADSSASDDHLPGDLLTSVEGIAHFRRIVLRADREWLGQAARDGRWHEKDGAWALVDPPSRDLGTWVVALGGPPAPLADLLGRLSPPWRADGGMTVEAPDDPAVAQVLDALGFAPAPGEHAYVVLEHEL